MSEEQAAPSPTEIERIVVNWLREHPEFFVRHPDLVESLRVPHPCEPAVSLLEYQNRLLRERGQRLHDKLLELVAIARDNDRLAERVQRLALDLLDASDEPDVLLHRIKTVLRDEFNADCVALCLEAALAAGSGTAEFLRPDALTLFEGLLQVGKPRCGRLRPEQAAALFGDCAPRVASAALVPMGDGQWRGLLALGSWDEQRFHPGAGTLFLGRAGELVGRALRARLLGGEWRARSDPPSAHEG
ncbi:MAG: DUF484 family protein [Candidatus Competibacter sp.]|nr:DUF484 family protein [Candidatus Competibacter sp.]MDG4584205.1 DUF484 family protein [Candidatus Competibacter sp.]